MTSIFSACGSKNLLSPLEGRAADGIRPAAFQKREPARHSSWRSTRRQYASDMKLHPHTRMATEPRPPGWKLVSREKRGHEKRQGVSLLPLSPAGVTTTFSSGEPRKCCVLRGQRPLGKQPAAVWRVAWGSLGGTPWQSPWGTLLLLGKRSRSARPCPTGARPHQARECPSRKQPP